jgi:hypothetical protein
MRCLLLALVALVIRTPTAIACVSCLYLSESPLVTFDGHVICLFVR